jgi:hypothetical protein
MSYCTPNDVRLRAVGMTEEVIPDVSSGSLNLTTCIAEAEAEIEEAGRAGDYEVPFDPVPDLIAQLAATGALVRARRALELGNGEDAYRRDYQIGLELLRRGQLDLGAVTVNSEAVTLPTEEGDWAQLAHRAVCQGSVVVKNEAGSFTYTEERRNHDPDYRPDASKDYVVDHDLGRVRRTEGSRLAPGQRVLVSYEYYRRQAGRPQNLAYAGRTAEVGELRRD